MTEFETNQQIADQICETLQWQGKAFSLGQFVSLLDGKVVAVEHDPLVAIEKLRNIDHAPQRGMMFEVGSTVIDVIRVY